MLTMSELQKLERQHYAVICAASETGGLSVAEAADAAVRLNNRLLSEMRALIAPKHRERYVPHQHERPRQQVLPYVVPAMPGSLS